MDDGAYSIEICRPIEAHARQIMDWRNDPVTLSVSLHKEPKVWASFWPEYRFHYFTQPHLSPLFLLKDGERVAFIRFRPAAHPQGHGGRTVDISLNVSPDHRGAGIGKTALRMAADFISRQANIDCLLAEIRSGNRASEQCFTSAGFKHLDAIEKTVEDTGEHCQITRFLMDLTPAFWRKERVMVIAEAGSNWRAGTPDRSAVSSTPSVTSRKQSCRHHLPRSL